MPASFEVNQVVEGTVTQLTPFGVFVELVEAPDLKAILHVSEMAEDSSDVWPADILQAGERRDFRILEVDKERRAITLSIKHLDEQPELS